MEKIQIVIVMYDDNSACAQLQYMMILSFLNMNCEFWCFSYENHSLLIFYIMLTSAFSCGESEVNCGLRGEEDFKWMKYGYCNNQLSTFMCLDDMNISVHHHNCQIYFSSQYFLCIRICILCCSTIKIYLSVWKGFGKIDKSVHKFPFIIVGWVTML